METPAAMFDRMQSLRSEVHVWLLDPAGVAAAAQARSFRAVLSAEELGRSERFRRDADRQAFIAAHGLLRYVLAAYAGISPADWRFAPNRWGRPEIAGPASAPPVRFSLSHTAGLVACAVGFGCECGVDVEALERRGDPLRVAKRVLAAAELDALESRPAAERRQTFLAYWTLKEAYVKARGTGLRLPLRKIAFDRGVGDEVRLASQEAGAPQGELWQFASLLPTADHVLGVAVQRPSGPSRTLCVREGLPD